jgi:hypothetical protein
MLTWIIVGKNNVFCSSIDTVYIHSFLFNLLRLLPPEWLIIEFDLNGRKGWLLIHSTSSRATRACWN